MPATRVLTVCASLAVAPLCADTRAAATNSPSPLRWSQLAALPDQPGVAAPFAGVSGGEFVVAGGANFPEKMPWEGGTKVWHDTVYALNEPGGMWRIAGRLPRPLGYGVSVTLDGAVLCVGGSDAERHFADSLTLRLLDGRIELTPGPPLPIPLANAAGALLGDAVLVVGGSEAPGEEGASRRCFGLRLDSEPPAWSEVEPLPGKARILPVVAARDGAFYVFGGAALEPVDGKVRRVYLRDAWRYRPGVGWRRLPDLPKPCVAAPSPAPVAGSRVYLLGGDDGSLAGFLPVAKHPGFPKSALVFDATRGTWAELSDILPVSRATVPVVEWRGMFVIPSGEARPGVRSPEVWTLRLNP